MAFGSPSTIMFRLSPDSFGLKLWTGCYERLAEVVACELLEVLDETACEILCLCIPSACVSVSVARIEDCRINSRELGRNFEVEVRDSLCRSFLD